MIPGLKSEQTAEYAEETELAENYRMFRDFRFFGVFRGYTVSIGESVVPVDQRDGCSAGLLRR